MLVRREVADLSAPLTDAPQRQVNPQVVVNQAMPGFLDRGIDTQFRTEFSVQSLSGRLAGFDMTTRHIPHIGKRLTARMPQAQQHSVMFYDHSASHFSPWGSRLASERESFEYLSLGIVGQRPQHFSHDKGNVEAATLKLLPALHQRARCARMSNGRVERVTAVPLRRQQEPIPQRLQASLAILDTDEDSATPVILGDKDTQPDGKR